MLRKTSPARRVGIYSSRLRERDSERYLLRVDLRDSARVDLCGPTPLGVRDPNRAAFRVPSLLDFRDAALVDLPLRESGGLRSSMGFSPNLAATHRRMAEASC